MRNPLLTVALPLEPNLSAHMFDPENAIAEFVRFPSVSTDPAFAEGLAGARDFIANLLEEIGTEVEIIQTSKHPIVLAQRTGPEDWPHVVIYGHYDVQPPDPLDLWETPPFEPVIRGDRLYGRGSADNKGPMMVHIAAAARLLEEFPDAPLRLTFIIEGEEEIGSPSFPKVLQDYGDRIKGDFVLLSDSLSPASDLIAITCGLRGLVSFEIHVDGPESDLHSGINGGALRNPIQALTTLCASFHDANGKVTIPGFYDDVLPPEDWEREQIARLQLTNADYAASVGAPSTWTIDGLSAMEATRLMPTLEFNGIRGGYIGKGEKTIIPSTAFTKISCRLVPNQNPDRIFELLSREIERRTPEGVRLRIQRGHDGPPYLVVPPHRPNTPPDQNPRLAKAFTAAESAIEDIFGNPPIFLREGGSIPIIGTIRKTLGMDAVMIGMFTPGDRLHAPNESFDLGMFRKGFEASYRTLKALIS